MRMQCVGGKKDDLLTGPGGQSCVRVLTNASAKLSLVPRIKRYPSMFRNNFPNNNNWPSHAAFAIISPHRIATSLRVAPIQCSYQGSIQSLSYECSTTNARWGVVRDKIDS